MARLALVALFLLGTLSCGVPSENTLLGTWSLTKVSCNGTLETTVTGVGMTLIFSASNRVLARAFTSTCSAREESAQLSFDGVDVAENSVSRLCSGGCTILGTQLPGEGASSCGTSATSLSSRTYRYRLAETGKMERQPLTANQFCATTDAAGNPIVETQLFTLSGS